MNKKQVDIVIVTMNRADLTKRCIESLLEKTSTPFNLIVVDNGSTDDTVIYLESLYKKNYLAKLLLLGRNMGISVAANLGWYYSVSENYIKLDNDIEIINSFWIEKLLTAAKDIRLGMIGYKLCPWHKTVPYMLSTGQIIGRFETCGGGCTLIPRHVHEKLGFWNEDYGLYGYEDLEYGVRANMAGLITGYIEDSDSVLHLGTGSNSIEEHEDIKKKSISKNSSGQKLYLINKFMFEQKIRPFFVERRYTSTLNNGQFKFKLNNKISSILSVQKYLLKNIGITMSDDIATLDLRNILQNISKAEN